MDKLRGKHTVKLGINGYHSSYTEAMVGFMLLIFTAVLTVMKGRQLNMFTRAAPMISV